MISLANVLAADDVKALLDKHGGGNYGPEVRRFFPREQALAIIHAAIWGHGCREDSTAGVYAFLALFESALGLKGWTFDEDEAEALQRYRQEKAAGGRKPMPVLGSQASRGQTEEG